MLDLIGPMSLVLMSWLLLFLLFSGLGMMALRLIGKPCASGWDWLDSFWLGWALSLATLQIWHFFFPVNEMILLLLALLAASQLIAQRESVASLLMRLRGQRAYLLGLALLALWLSNRALAMPTAYDSGFRDIQAVMWIDAYPIVPGLGNLFSSLAFNHSVYLYDALLDVSVWSGRSQHIATGLLLMTYLAGALRSSLNLGACRSAGAFRWSRMLAALTIPYLLFFTVGRSGISHFLTDTVVDIVGFLCVAYFLDYLQDRDTAGIDQGHLVLRLAILILVGLTIKQTFIVFGLALAATVAFVWLNQGEFRRARKRAVGLLRLIAALASIVLLPWLARGVVSSGYIAFPQTVGRVEVDWAIPHEQLLARQRAMSTNTRIRGGNQDEVLGAWDWFGPWLRKFANSIMPAMLPSLIAVGALGLYAAGRRRNRSANRARGPGLIALAPLLAMLTIWFLTYPEPKYVRYILWSMAAISVILAFEAWPNVSFRGRLIAAYGVAMLCLAYVALLIVVRQSFPLPAGPDDGFYDHWPVAYEQYVTDSGLRLNVPRDGAQCWQAPLPCTPYPDARLESRVPGELRHGFRIAKFAETGPVDA
ncbi:MAG: hypothetical protein F4X02_09220 [Chloroflexi bacterium]|nr:hypothetical protein [Chloroflexota bacterium]